MPQPQRRRRIIPAAAAVALMISVVVRPKATASAFSPIPSAVRHRLPAPAPFPSGPSSSRSPHRGLCVGASAPPRPLRLSRDEDGSSGEDAAPPLARPEAGRRRGRRRRRRIELSWCDRDTCQATIREKVVGANNHVEFAGPATGQVVYSWTATDGGIAPRADDDSDEVESESSLAAAPSPPPTVLLLVKRDDADLMAVAADAVRNLTSIVGVRVLLDPELAAKLKHYYRVDDEEYIGLFDPKPPLRFGNAVGWTAGGAVPARSGGGGALPPGGHGLRRCDDGIDEDGVGHRSHPAEGPRGPDLICTLGGDGLLMHASSLFPGPVPPILCIAGGSMGFLTPFAKEEMVDAIESALGLCGDEGFDGRREECRLHLAASQPGPAKFRFDTFHRSRVCLSMRMRLDCHIVNREGVVRGRFVVLNEVAIDRGSSPYLANLECYCDDVHLTTVQADGVIFSTPTGSTAYSMAAGGSVVHPAVPAILVTPICPHVLSFRPMVLPDHVVLRCYVPDDARSSVWVAFDGKKRRELRRGDSIRISMSQYPVPTINRMDHSSDWLNSLKRNFNFNTRVRQNPL